jgi:REP element-mobilizing transposase RayT
MPARRVQFAPGTYYHIYNRGANRSTIFRNGDNYEYVLRLIKDEIGKLKLAMIAYCLMPTHYHWFVRQDGEHPAGKLPQNVFNRYSKAFNNAYNHSGTLFETRYKAIVVESDEYIRHLCCYIHCNPVVANLAIAPELWPYSNYVDWIGKRNGALMDRPFIQTFFPDIQRYQQLISDHLQGQHPIPQGLKEHLSRLS